MPSISNVSSMSLSSTHSAIAESTSRHLSVPSCFSISRAPIRCSPMLLGHHRLSIFDCRHLPSQPITCGTKSGFSTFLSGSTKALISKSCVISRHHPLHPWNTAEQRVTSRHVILATCIRRSLPMGSWRRRHTPTPPTLPGITRLTVTTIKQAAAMTAASCACLEQMTRGWMTWIPRKGMVARSPGTGSSGLMGIPRTWVRFFSLTIRYTC